MDEIGAIVLVGGRGSRLQNLTHNKTKSYVSFLGKYRIIDYALSSISYSGIRSTGIITQYEPYELMRYIGSGQSWDLDYFSKGVSFLTPFESLNTEVSLQKGTAHALSTQIDYIRRMEAENILVLSGDQIYKIDFNEVLKFHKEHNCELTIISKDLDETKEDLRRFGIIEYDNDGRIVGFEEKPQNPKSNRISLGMYLFKKESLLKYLLKADELTDFGSDLIPYILKDSDKVFSYPYNGTFMDVGTIESLYKGNMYFLDNPVLLDERGARFKIYSKPYDYPPHIIKKGASVKNSIVSDGCVLYGNVSHSVLSYNDRIMEGAIIRDSVVLPNVHVGKNAYLENCLVDEDTYIPDDATLKFDKPTLIGNFTFERHE